MSRSKRYLLLLFFALFSVSILACDLKDDASDQLLVVTSIYPVYDFSQKVAGDLANVVVMTPPGTDPHDWDPNPADMIMLQKADLFVYNGAGIEHWVDAALDALDLSSTHVINTSDGLIDLHNNDIDHDHDHHHDADPHIWLDPMLAKQQMKAILNALITVDPDHEADYKANFDIYSQKLDELDAAYRQALEPYQGRIIVVSHEAFGYMCAAYGLHQMGIRGLSSDTEPDAARMREIIDFINNHQIEVIFTEALVSPKVAQAIADETGARLMQLDTIGGGVGDNDDYFSLMEANLATLLSAFSSSDNN